MTIRKVHRRGQTRLVVDITWKKTDGTQGRYRRDAEVQTMAAARAEERRVLANIAQHGDAFEPKLEIARAEIAVGDEPGPYRSGKRDPHGGGGRVASPRRRRATSGRSERWRSNHWPA